MISILLPVRNEGKYIQRCLESVFSQAGVDEIMEVIVADGMSDDGTRAIIQSFQQEHPQLVLVDNPRRIVSTGLNLATTRARGEILVRVDGHCEIAPDYVSRCVAYLREGIADGVGGPMQTIGENQLAETIALAMSSPFGVGNSAFRTSSIKTAYVDTIPFPAYTRSIVEKVGPYDEELVRDQDDEYNYRIRAAGGKLLLAADVRSRYYSRANIKQLWRQFFQYGFYKVRVMQKHPRQMSLRQFAPPALAAGTLISLILAAAIPWWWIFFAGTAGVYLLFVLAATLVTCARKGWKHLPVLPLCFVTMHYGYGFGFLAGLGKFFNRWGPPIGRRDAIDGS